MNTESGYTLEFPRFYASPASWAGVRELLVSWARGRVSPTVCSSARRGAGVLGAGVFGTLVSHQGASAARSQGYLRAALDGDETITRARLY